jgi:glycosyltransferase involved in cell wall biosynthesis
VFDHERFLPACLASIDAQDHDDLEVIVVDDGSRDRSWDVLSSHRWRPGRRVSTVRTANQGAHAAINLGLRLASGDYIALCNSDDRFAPGRIRTLLARVRDAGARFAFSRVGYVDQDDHPSTAPFAGELGAMQDSIAAHRSVGFALLLKNVAISSGNFFFARSLVDDIGYFRPYRQVHDWDFILRALLFTEPLFVPEPLYVYRLHSDNSFAKLEDVAHGESAEVLRRFMRATIMQRHPNLRAPSPRNWPGYFERFVDEHWLRPFLEGWSADDAVFYRPPPDAPP